MKVLRMFLALALLTSGLAFGANNDFTGTASTQISTYDSTWVSCVQAGAGHDGSTDLNLNGSGRLRTGSFKFSDAVRTDGGPNSHSHIIVKAGEFNPNTVDISVAVRRTPTTQGYEFRLDSSTNLATNIDQVNLYRNNASCAGQTITPINAATTDIDLVGFVTNTVDLRFTINSQTFTFAGSGGNDACGAAVLTGGNAGLSILLNSSTLTDGLIDNWTDDAAAGLVVNPISGKGGPAAQPLTLNRNKPAANDDVFLLRAVR